MLYLSYRSSICVVRSHLSDIVGVHGLDNLRLSLKLLVFGALLQPFLKLVYTSLLLQTRIFWRRWNLFRVIICVLNSFRSFLALLKPLMVLLWVLQMSQFFFSLTVIYHYSLPVLRLPLGTFLSCAVWELGNHWTAYCMSGNGRQALKEALRGVSGSYMNEHCCIDLVTLF